MKCEADCLKCRETDCNFWNKYSDILQMSNEVQKDV